MTGRHECEAFQLRLEERPLRETGPEERKALDREVAGCPDCAAFLRMRELLEAPPTGELEAAVPDLHVRGMWPRVREATRSAPPGRGARQAFRSRAIVPVLSAAVVVLALVVSLLVADRARLVDGQSALAARLADQERRLSALEGSGGAPASWAVRPGDADWERALERRDAVTLGQIRDWLRRVPSGTTLVDPAGLAALDIPAPLQTSGPWKALLGNVDTRDGLQAGELLDALSALGIPDDESIPTRRLLQIYRETL
jgi:hypothetical protein